jgi:hypothetical protein
MVSIVLQGQRSDYRGVLRNRFSGGPGLGTVYEDLGNAAVVEPTDPTGVHLAPAFKPVQPVWPAVLEPLARDWRGHVSDPARL